MGSSAVQPGADGVSSPPPQAARASAAAARHSLMPRTVAPGPAAIHWQRLSILGYSRAMRRAEKRCTWPGEDPLYVAYHDDEWGVPERDDRALFEKLLLDGFQAGLSWITILRKRPNFRAAFAGFDPEKLARFGARERTRLMADAGIVRNRAKIDGAIASARAYLAL